MLLAILPGHSFLTINKEFLHYSLEMTKPYTIKISILYSIKNKVSQFWDKKGTDKRIDEGKRCFHFFSFFYWFLFSFSFDLWSFSSFFRFSSQQTTDKYPRSCLSLIINNIKCVTRYTGNNTLYIKLPLLSPQQEVF